MNSVKQTVMRIWQLMKLEVYSQKRRIFISAAGILGIFIILSLLSWLFMSPESSFELNGTETESGDSYGLIFIIWALVLTAGSFLSLHAKSQQIEYLLRPASGAEKVAASVLVTTVGYWALMTIGYLLSLLFLQLMRSIFGIEGSLFPRGFLGTSLRTLYSYLSIHALVFFAAVYFKRNAIGKLLLFSALGFFALMVLNTLAARLIFAPYFADPALLVGIETRLGFYDSFTPIDFIQQQLGIDLQQVYDLRHVFAAVWIAVLWGLSWLRLRETEV